MGRNIAKNVLINIKTAEEERLKGLEGKFHGFMKMRFREYLQMKKKWEEIECIDFKELGIDADDLQAVGEKLGFNLKLMNKLKYNVSIPKTIGGQNQAQIMLEEFNVALNKAIRNQENEAEMIYQNILDAISKKDFTYKKANEGLWEITVNVIVSNEQLRQCFDKVKKLLIADGFIDLISLSSMGAVLIVKSQ